MSGHVFVLLADICRSGLVFAGLGLYLQVWDVFASLIYEPAEAGLWWLSPNDLDSDDPQNLKTIHVTSLSLA
jgi:hypothetical protein